MSHLPVTYFQVSHLGDFHSSHPGPRESVLFFSYLRWNTRITFLYSDFETGLEARKPAFLFAPACLNFLFFFFPLPSLAFIMANGGRSESTFWNRNADKIPKRLLQWRLLTKIVDEEEDHKPSLG